VLTGRASHSQVARRVPQLQAADEAAAREAVDALAAAIGEAAAATGAREDEEGLPTPFAAAAAQEGCVRLPSAPELRVCQSGVSPPHRHP